MLSSAAWRRALLMTKASAMHADEVSSWNWAPRLNSSSFWFRKTQANPVFPVPAIQTASVLTKIRSGGRDYGPIERGIGGWGCSGLVVVSWACSHSLAARIDLLKTSEAVEGFFSKRSWLRDVHICQQIQGRTLLETLSGGRLIQVVDTMSAVLKVETCDESKGVVHAPDFQTSWANRQWKSIWSEVSGSPHLQHEAVTWIFRLCRFSQVGRELCPNFHENILSFGKRLGDQFHPSLSCFKSANVDWNFDICRER